MLLVLMLVVPSSWACSELIGMYEPWRGADMQYRVKRQKNKFVLMQRQTKSERWNIIESSTKRLSPNEIARRFGVDTDGNSCAIEYKSGVLVKTFIGARYVRQVDQNRSPGLTPSRTGVLLFPVEKSLAVWGKDIYPLEE
ncbi:hypothetical protein DBR37_03185 [Herminiimonas sp. KBW02]|nr:hypothetical protein DBR37_03185 [Herminiimonas sp. KBW02]